MIASVERFRFAKRKPADVHAHVHIFTPRRSSSRSVASHCGAAAGLLALLVTRTLADGGVVRLQQSSGPFLITVSTAPEPLRMGLIDISVLLQPNQGGSPILDAAVGLELQPPAGNGATVRTAATHVAARNKLFYAALVNVAAPGDWQLQVSVQRGADQARVRCTLPVAPPLPALIAIWPYLAIPPFAILLYAVHQWLRRQTA